MRARAIFLFFNAFGWNQTTSRFSILHLYIYLPVYFSFWAWLSKNLQIKRISRQYNFAPLNRREMSGKCPLIYLADGINNSTNKKPSSNVSSKRFLISINTFLFRFDCFKSAQIKMEQNFNLYIDIVYIRD